MSIKTLGLATVMSMTLCIPAVYAAGSYGTEENAMDGDSEKMQQSETMEQGMQSTPFAELDANQDGVLTEDELNVYGSTAAGNPDGQPMSGQETRDMMMELDRDSDGQLTQDEFESMEE
ncbi:EF-hand domain-containing protein [Marinobacter lipolyticus]|uniref:EF-hand domain-containing protein n=1 Tax=Marinobacter lipolyticus TaxID=209639 RepID=UPI003A8E920D